MKKWIVFLGLFSIFLTGCYKKKADNHNVAITECGDSLVTQWFGANHYKCSTNSSSSCSDAKESAPSLMTPGGLIVAQPSNESSTCSTCPKEEHFFSDYLFSQEMPPVELLNANENSSAPLEDQLQL